MTNTIKEPNFKLPNQTVVTSSGSGPMLALVVNLVGVAISFSSTKVSGLLTLGNDGLATFCGRDGLFFCIGCFGIHSISHSLTYCWVLTWIC